MGSAEAIYADSVVPNEVAAIIRAAKTDFPSFCTLILKDEESGLPIFLQPFQEEWIDALLRFRNVVIWAFPESGKSQLLSIARIVWELGRNPRRRYAVLSATQSQAKKIIRSIQGHIVENPLVRLVFPGLRRGKLWTDTAIEVSRPSGIRDPSVQAFSPEAGSMQGTRIDGLVIDDVLNENNTRTAYQREKIGSWIKATAFSRLSTNAWICFMTNAWHPQDFAHECEALGWWAGRYPVILPDGSSAWPDRWPVERIDKVRRDKLGPLEFARQMMCQPRDESTARFKKEWIDSCLELGEGYTTFRSVDDLLERDPSLAAEIGLIEGEARIAAWRLGGDEPRRFPREFMAVTGVDVAISKKSSADLSCLFTILLWPDGLRQVLEVQSGRWSGPELVDRIVSVHERFGSIVVVETNAAQGFVLQWSKERVPGMPLRSFITGRNKLSLEYGIESLASEFANAMWLIPCRSGDRLVEPEIRAWISEALDYDPRAHTGDRLMASWIAREYARSLQERLSRRGGGVIIPGKYESAPKIA